MKQVEDIKQEKKSLKQLFKKYIHRALIDDEFISQQTVHHGLNSLLAEFYRMELVFTQSALPNTLTLLQKNYIIETYPLIAKLIKLKFEVEESLKQTKTGGNGEKLDDKFGQLFGADKCSPTEFEEIDKIYLKLSDENKQYIQQQQDKFCNLLGNNTVMSKRTSNIFKLKFDEINVVDKIFTNTKTQELKIMNDKFVTNLQSKYDMKYLKHQACLLFGKTETSQLLRSAIEQIKYMEVKQKTRLLATSMNKFDKDANTNNASIQRAFTWLQDQKKKISRVKEL